MRNSTIDSLRGLAIVAMIMLHTNAYFLSRGGWVSFSWNWLHFAVALFVFCSVYLFWKKAPAQPYPVMEYIKKRVLRLLIPYYMFLLVFLPIIYLGEPQKITPAFLWQNLTLTGGLDLNWLVALFLCLTLLQPLLDHWRRNRPALFHLYGIVSLSSAVAFLFYRPAHYKLIMWLPWSVLLVYAYFFVVNEKRRLWWVGSVFGGLILVIAAYQVLILRKAPLGMYQNKYPPNLLVIAYGLVAITALYIICRTVNRCLPLNRLGLGFFSRYSYEIFFLHFLVIYILTVFFKIAFSPLGFFVGVLAITIATQIGLNKLRQFLFSVN